MRQRDLISAQTSSCTGHQTWQRWTEIQFQQLLDHFCTLHLWLLPQIPLSATEGRGTGDEEEESEMKAEALSVRECAWMSDECHLLDEL